MLDFVQAAGMGIPRLGIVCWLQILRVFFDLFDSVFRI